MSESKVVKLHTDNQALIPNGRGTENDRMIVQLTVKQLREIIRDEIQSSHTENIPTSRENDHFLTTEEAATLLNVKSRWLYRNARRLPFTRRLSRKALRFSRLA